MLNEGGGGGGGGGGGVKDRDRKVFVYEKPTCREEDWGILEMGFLRMRDGRFGYILLIHHHHHHHHH